MPEPALCQMAVLGMPANALHVSNLAETSKHPNLLTERIPGLTPASGESQQPNGLSGAPGGALSHTRYDEAVVERVTCSKCHAM